MAEPSQDGDAYALVDEDALYDALGLREGDEADEAEEPNAEIPPIPTYCSWLKWCDNWFNLWTISGPNINVIKCNFLVL